MTIWLYGICPAVESSLDKPIRTAFDQFKNQWIHAGRPGSPIFAVYARNDPLTTCAVPPARVHVAKVKENPTSAVYTVTYKLAIDRSPGLYHKAESTVTLVKKGGQWLVSEASNAFEGNASVKTYTFVSRLKELSKLIE